MARTAQNARFNGAYMERYIVCVYVENAPANPGQLYYGMKKFEARTGETLVRIIREVVSFRGGKIGFFLVCYEAKCNGMFCG